MVTISTAPGLPNIGDDVTDQSLLTGIEATYRNAVDSRVPVFTTDATRLWETFLAHLPSDELRAVYACRTCEAFVNTYGGLVAIGGDGKIIPVMWGFPVMPGPFSHAIHALYKRVVVAEVTGVFVSSDTDWGKAVTHDLKRCRDWHHMHVPNQNVYVARVTYKVDPETGLNKPVQLTASQVMAEKLQDFEMLGRAMAEYPIALANKAVTMLESGGLYRSEKVLPWAKWYRDLLFVQTQDVYANHNRLWHAVATAPTGFCHVKSGMLGTLLEDLKQGLTLETVARNFQEKMAPDRYQHTTAAPSVGNIAEAERVITGLQSAGSLNRRYARMDEIFISAFQWTDRHRPQIPVAPGKGVFGHIAPKAPAPKPENLMTLPDQTMTWAKFSREVLPKAQSIEAKVISSRLMALVTASDRESPPILQWDTENFRNPVSWYYAGGIDAEIQRRVIEAGGQHDNVDIRVSLIWNNRNDLDLHCITPSGEEIFFGNKRGRCGGWLDVDRNVGGETVTPVENTRWAKGTAPRGTYRFFVRNYRFHESIQGPTTFRVELEIAGVVYHYDGVISTRGQTGERSDIMVASFNYQGMPLTTSPLTTGGTTVGSFTPNGWTVVEGTYVPVKGIVNSPNFWNEAFPLPQHGSHTFFLLEGCQDLGSGKGRGLFTETLKSEYRPIRSTLEAYMASATIEGADQASACGIGMNNAMPWNLSLRVRTQDSVQTYLIDRMD